tara:strand:- start:272 stop:1015 length:744 start_codon:yes stop_codon:yes gene_type:complete
MKSMNDGIRGLMLKAGYAFDLIDSDHSKEISDSSENLIALLTPILKSFATDKSMEITNQALQIYGGHGYITDHGMEQLVRDARITPIYEGTNGIQALDLIGRKFNIHDGLIINQYLDEINKFLNDNKNNKRIHKFIKFFEPSYSDLKDCINFIKEIELKNSKEINSHAVDFLNIFALVAVGFTWLQFIEISLNKTEKNNDDFYFSKIQLGEFYLTKVIFETQKYKNNIYTSGKLYNDFEDKYFESGI